MFRYYGQKYNVDANTLKQGAYYLTVGCTHVPNEYCYLLCITSSIEGTANGDVGQIAFNVNNIWFRRKSSNAWSEWKAVISQ